jgi:hypothetical protein
MAAAAPNFKLAIPEIALQNLFSLPSEEEFEDMFEHGKLESITFLNCTRDDEELGGPISFVEASYPPPTRP